MVIDEELRGLLDSDEYRACKEAWMRRSGVRFAAEPESSIITGLLQDSLRDADLTVADVRAVLSDEEFLRFLEGKAVLDGHALDDQEYPEGEEPDPYDADDVIEVQGYVHSAVASNAVWYLVASDSQTRLLALLKKQKIPQAATFARQLTALLPER